MAFIFFLMSKIKRVTVYCASSNKVDKKYFDLASKLGAILAQNEITTIYGGSSMGLMAELANSALKNKGQVIGIMPSFMDQVEWSHKGLSGLVLCNNMRERKELLIQDTDALIALPGGCGTLEELMEAITLKRLGQFTKPIVIVNLDGFYDALIELFQKMIQENFLRKEHQSIWTVVNSAEEILDAIENAPLWNSDAIKFAAV